MGFLDILARRGNQAVPVFLGLRDFLVKRVKEGTHFRMDWLRLLAKRESQDNLGFLGSVV